MTWPALPSALTLVLLVNAPLTIAEVYKVTEQDGGLLYTDQAPQKSPSQKTPESKQNIEKIGDSLAAQEKANTVPATIAVEKKTNGQNSSSTSLNPSKNKRHQQAIESTKRRIKELTEQLQLAQDPQEQDFIGNLNGGVRLRSEYWDRIEKLESDLKQANKKLDQLRKKRN